MSDLSGMPRPQPLRDATSDAERWRALTAQVGADIAAPLTRALERLQALGGDAADAPVLRALRRDLDAARQAGLAGQQLARYGDARLRQARERLELAHALKHVVVYRGRETQARGIQLKQIVKPAAVMADATLLHALLNSLFDWALEREPSRIEFRVDTTPGTTWSRLELNCDVPLSEATAPAGLDDDLPLDSLSWRLVEQAVKAMELGLERYREGGRLVVRLEFRRGAAPSTKLGAAALESTDGFTPSTNPMPLAGNQVLVITARADLWRDVVEATRHLGLLIDLVGTVSEAHDFCRDGLPHAILYESGIADQAFADLRRGILSDVPELAFIEIVDDGDTLEMSSFEGAGIARIGRQAIAASLPTALMFELTKSY